MKFHSVLLTALSSLAFLFASPASAQNGPVEIRYAGSFRDNSCTVTLQWVTTVDSVNVSGSLTTQSGAVLQVSGAETSPGLLELTVETDESINHKLSHADVKETAAKVEDKFNRALLLFTERIKSRL